MVEGYDPLQEQMRIASQYEMNSKWELAYRNFHDVAKKALEQMANCQDPAKKEQLKQLAETAISQAQWSKQMIED